MFDLHKTWVVFDAWRFISFWYDGVRYSARQARYTAGSQKFDVCV